MKDREVSLVVLILLINYIERNITIYYGMIAITVRSSLLGLRRVDYCDVMTLTD